MLNFTKQRKKRISKRVADLLEKMAATAMIAAYIQNSFYLLFLGVIFAIFCISYEYIGDENE